MFVGRMGKNSTIFHKKILVWDPSEMTPSLTKAASLVFAFIADSLVIILPNNEMDLISHRCHLKSGSKMAFMFLVDGGQGVREGIHHHGCRNTFWIRVLSRGHSTGHLHVNQARFISQIGSFKQYFQIIIDFLDIILDSNFIQIVLKSI